MYSADQVRVLLTQQKLICANILIEKNGKANFGDILNANTPDIAPDLIPKSLPDDCIINPHFDCNGYLDGGYLVKNGIIVGHIDPRGEKGEIGKTGK